MTVIIREKQPVFKVTFEEELRKRTKPRKKKEGDVFAYKLQNKETGQYLAQAPNAYSEPLFNNTGYSWTNYKVVEEKWFDYKIKKNKDKKGYSFPDLEIVKFKIIIEEVGRIATIPEPPLYKKYEIFFKFANGKELEYIIQHNRSSAIFSTVDFVEFLKFITKNHSDFEYTHVMACAGIGIDIPEHVEAIARENYKTTFIAINGDAALVVLKMALHDHRPAIYCNADVVSEFDKIWK